MNWATQNGIINGINGALYPQDSTTRSQMATILMRFDALNK
ncbi:S-layer homology domain-containing protein [Candidatus Heritagella caecorum]|uniref:S-layer homology domain-containing protein n=1 Tax=Pseudoflavonifractor capillosus TaxID=106588 RepID=A0A921MP45_9FIRM|nr:S-layer homology domain-containing protein [Pseudoflavonifractor capillosus]